jgi:hypothetical protein
MPETSFSDVFLWMHEGTRDEAPEASRREERDAEHDEEQNWPKGRKAPSREV